MTATQVEISSQPVRNRDRILNDILSWLDSCLREEVTAFRKTNVSPIEEFQGIYISDQSVDSFLSHGQTNKAQRIDADFPPVLKQLNNLAEWSRLISNLGLNPVDIALLVIALAPEVDLKYETIYSYLQNDISRKLPTRDLAIRLLSRFTNRPSLIRSALGAGAPLFRFGILVSNSRENTERGSWRSGAFTIDPLAAHALLYGQANSTSLPVECRYSNEPVSWIDVPVDADLRSDLARLPAFFESGRSDNASYGPAKRQSPVIVFEGADRKAAELAAISLASALDTGAIFVDLQTAAVSRSNLAAVLGSAYRHQALFGSVVSCLGFESIMGETYTELLGVLRSCLDRRTGASIFFWREPESVKTAFEGIRAISLRFDPPGHTVREQLWKAEFSDKQETLSEEVQGMLVDRFILTSGQIEAATQHALDVNQISGQPVEEHILEAARLQCRLSLGSLARRVSTPFTYDDLILPDVTKSHVREIASAIKFKGLVYNDWKLGLRFPQGQGIKVLFSGASGTGKTMSAAVIAREVGLDLYAINLSAIVSKYIGETEKNLDKVFAATHNSNAILFFDECDALFGKRSEVKDAHDRYANIEVAYLLQKMEAHEGAVIMATNFSRNMDPAFARRMQYVIEFPVPAPDLRERLWRGMFPEGAPLSQDIDFAFLAEHFAISGGDIRNVALDSAFLAAQDGDTITMQHLIRAMARQLVKQGRTPSSIEFKQYFPLVSRES